KYLIRNSNIRPRYGDAKTSPIMLLAHRFYGDDTIIRLLIQEGEDPHETDQDGATAFDYCPSMECRQALLNAAPGPSEDGSSIESQPSSLPSGFCTQEFEKSDRVERKPAALLRAFLSASGGYIRTEEGIQCLQLLVSRLKDPVSQSLSNEIWAHIDFRPDSRSYHPRAYSEEFDKEDVITQHPLLDLLLSKNIVGYPLGAECTDALDRYLNKGLNPVAPPHQGYRSYRLSLISGIWICPDAKARLHRLLDAGAAHPDMMKEIYTDLIREDLLNEKVLRKLSESGLNPNRGFRDYSSKPLCLAISMGKPDAVRLLLKHTDDPFCPGYYQSILSPRVYALRLPQKFRSEKILAMLPESDQSHLEELLDSGNPDSVATFLRKNPALNIDLVQLEKIQKMDENLASEMVHRLDGTGDLIEYAGQKSNAALARMAIEQDAILQTHLLTVASHFPDLLPQVLKRRSEWPSHQLDSSLIAVVREGNLEAARVLIQVGANIQVRYAHSYSLLNLAVENREMYLFLQKQGVHPSPHDSPPLFSTD
ncbi:MAG: hypothetical protein KDK23_17455, partial [Leptospiraceae bacterium]|nr:hypothetical protein [Leptospiraceae bacterium]